MGRLLLVRHGQASWDAEDYDVLSPTGWEQGRLLGAALASRGTAPTGVVRGGLRRHRETAEALLEGGSSWDLDAVEVDPGWDEFDHVAMLAAHPAPFEGRPDSPAQFQAWFEEATDRWTAGHHDEDYAESFAQFTARVGAAVRRTAERVGSGTVLVVTSGGPVAAVAAALLSGGDVDVAAALWLRLNPVCVNSGVTRLVTGRRGLTLVSFNDHSHLDGVDGVLTYR